MFGGNKQTCHLLTQAQRGKLDCKCCTDLYCSHTEDSSTVAARTLTEDLLTFHNTTIFNVHRSVPACACVAGREWEAEGK